MRTIAIASLICMVGCPTALGEYWPCLGKVLQESEFAAQVQVVTREKAPPQRRLVRIYWEEEGFERLGELKSLPISFPFTHLAKGDSIRTQFAFYGRGQHLMTLDAENGFIQYPGTSAEPPSDAGCVFNGSVIEFHDLLLQARHLRQRGIPINGNLVPTVFGFDSYRESLCADLSDLSWRDVLESVHAMLELEDQFPRVMYPAAIGGLRARCAVLRYPHHPAESLAEVRAIADPFYASLALGAMAAQTVNADAEQAKTLLLEAEQTASRITQWTGSDATSMGYLFQVIPLFPKVHAKSVLLASRRKLMQWEADGHRKSHPMRVLTEVAIEVDPSEVSSLLTDVLQYGHHTCESARAIGRFLARQSPDEAWKTVEAMSREDTSVFSPLSAGVLAELALTDLPIALKRLETLPEWKRLIVGVQMGYYLLEDKEDDKVRAIVDYLEPLSEKAAQFQNSVAQLRARLETETQSQKDSSQSEIGAEVIARFLEKPNMNDFQSIVNARRVTFASRVQSVEFVKAGLPLARQIDGASFDCSLKGAAWSDYRFLACVAASAGDAEQTFRACYGVHEIGSRLSLLLEAHELANPLPIVIEDWPLGFRETSKVAISFADNAESQPSE